jgi:hypothetical protein
MGRVLRSAILLLICPNLPATQLASRTRTTRAIPKPNCPTTTELCGKTARVVRQFGCAYLPGSELMNAWTNDCLGPAITTVVRSLSAIVCFFESNSGSRNPM